MGLAQTGTGKTAAFGLPLLHRLLDIGHPPGPKNVRALILAPTRELIAQIKDNFEVFTKGTAVKITMVVGGASLFKQAQALSKGTDVLVATPGRLIDLLERGDVKLDQCAYLVLDEADHMLDMGFIHSLRKIAKHIPLKRQTMLFSATMPKDISEIADTYLRDPIKVQVAPPGKPVERISQGVHYIPNGDKARVLEEYLKKHPGEQALVFGRTKHGSEKLMKLLAVWGFKVGSIHGNKTSSATASLTCWSPQTSPHAGSTFRPCATSTTSTCRTCRKTMSTASAVRHGRGPMAPRSASVLLPRWASCRPSKRC